MSDPETLVLYHANCADGFTAAWAASLALPGSTTFVALDYGDTPPDVEGKEVYVLDFSFHRVELEIMHACADSLLVLDHHKTAEADLAGLDYCTFDTTKSGAMLAWEHFHDEPAPDLVRYVQDRDLWTWKLRRSEQINAYIGGTPQTFTHWTALARELGTQWVQAEGKGSAYATVTKQYVARIRGFASRTALAGYDVPIINTTFARSELIGALAEGEPFAIGWRLEEGKYCYSLRSHAGGVDVSAVAQIWGGGGHRNAAEFELETLLIYLVEAEQCEA